MRSIRRAIQGAYREYADSRRWKYLQRHMRVLLHGDFSSGSITYDHTGAASCERLASATSFSWPAWAGDGTLRIGGIEYRIDNRLSSIRVQLDDTVNPGSDLASTTYSLFQSKYSLPEGFIGASEIMMEDNWWYSSYVPPQQWLAMERFGEGVGTPQAWTIMGDPARYGRMAIYLYPAPDSDATMDFVVQQRPRGLRYTGFNSSDYVGTVSVTNGGITVTGSGTAFDALHEGAIIRISSNSQVPGNEYDALPCVFQRRIREVASATSLTVDEAFTSSLSSVAYVISDPVDCSAAYLDYFLRLCEKHLAIAENMDSKAETVALASEAFRIACYADNRVVSTRRAGSSGPSRLNRLAYMPYGGNA